MKRFLASLGFLLLVASVTPDLQTGNSLALGVDGGSFTINGRPRFLVFVSYFDGLDVSNASLATDFAWLKSRKVGGVRVFPNWWNKNGNTTMYPETPLIKADGSLDATRLAKLRRLLSIARTHGLVVDLSFSGENVKPCSGAGCATSSPFVPSGTLTKGQLQSGLEKLTADLRSGGFANTLIDIQNEADYNTLFVPSSARATLKAADIKAIADAIHAVNAKQIVTASISGGTSAADAGALAASSGVDVAAWHETRNPVWWKATAANIAALRSKTGKPIYFQEPQPSNDSGWTADGAAASMKAALASGAAAWTFHTRSSFALNGTSLKSVINSAKSPNDRNFLNAQIGAQMPTIRR